MAERNAIVQLATDIYRNKVNTNFASSDMEENKRKIYEALVEINGGTKLDYKMLANGRANGLFAILEQILVNTGNQGMINNPFFNQFCDFRNLSVDGDENSFYVPDNSLFLVSQIADGVNSLRRQRINKGTTTAVPTALRGIEAYEEAKRLLAGRIDIVEFIDKIQKSMLQDKLKLAYTTFYGGLSSLPSEFTTTGSYSESELVDIIQHVEAEGNDEAIIIGTMNALRNVTTAIISESAKESYNSLGFYGTFNGKKMMMIPQSHKTDGTYDFEFSDSDLWIVSAGNKPIKFVTQGNPIMEVSSLMQNADGTVNMLAVDNYGAAIVINELWGHYRIS